MSAACIDRAGADVEAVGALGAADEAVRERVADAERGMLGAGLQRLLVAGAQRRLEPRQLGGPRLGDQRLAVEQPDAVVLAADDRQGALERGRRAQRHLGGLADEAGEAPQA